MNWFDLLLLPENLLWAWRKVKRAYRTADSLYDQAAVAAFELDLEAQLESISIDFASGRWQGTPLRLVPQPKKPDKDGHPRLRQYFQVAVRDQVAWCALTNVLGPELDRKMPSWSYGNRLYRAAWYEREPSDARPSKLNIGPYRHSAGHLYRHFKHSWPLYRRHISLSARKMVADHIDPDGLDHGERLALEQSDGLPYLEPGHWIRPENAGDTIYAASLDLRKFYPSVRTAAIIRGFETLVADYEDDPRLSGLITQMLAFTVNDAGLSSEMKAAVDPPVASGPFGGIPTGLFVGGFLANVAMLPIDLEVDALILTRRDIAHFRFVDDHEVLAYDFGTIVAWMADYAKLLEKHGLGAEIEPDKFVPAELKWVLNKDAPDRPSGTIEELTAIAAGAAAVNGRKPTELMTRTLAQVSMLAAIDFDLLTDTGRAQRLEQLEWLLLANIPEQEIRGDTRMSFAAARIAMLTPSLFRPNDTLLEAQRALQVLLAARPRDQAIEDAIAEDRSAIANLETEEREDWDKLLKRHFGLLFEAFSNHPDKVRLFIRLLDFCRVTGYDGFVRVTGWMYDHRSGDHEQLCCYLGALALQTLSRHVLTASEAVKREDLLHRERQAARAFLVNVANAKLTAFLNQDMRSPGLQHFQSDALRALIAALVMGGVEVSDAEPDVGAALLECVAFGGRAIGDAPIRSLAVITSVPLGVWYHWFFASANAYRQTMPSYWRQVTAALDPALRSDWNSMRRYPEALPEHGWEWLREHPDALVADDAGWLLEAARGAPNRFLQLLADNPLVDEIRTRIEPLSLETTLRDWVLHTATLKPNDPRRSEWTALEIIRQVLKPLFHFSGLNLEGRDPDYLDSLHPENVRIPYEWRMASEISVDDPLTWEGWKRHVRNHPVQVADSGIADYRYREVVPTDNPEWPRRLRPIGQLLWGILRRSFSLPAAWNIRGQERGLMEIVAWDLERLPISSFTLSILQSCLLPRNRESSLFELFPSLFGTRERKADDDTEFDRPILSPEQLDTLLERAQKFLQLTQMTVLEHEPRQLIPVRLRQLGAFEVGAAEAEDLT